MDRIRQAARALCCWPTEARPASPDASSVHSNAAQSVSSGATLAPLTASGQGRRQQIVENQGGGSPTVTTGNVVLAAAAQQAALATTLAAAHRSGSPVSDDLPLAISPESEAHTAQVTEVLGQSAASLSPLSPPATLRSNVARQAPPATHDSTPSSLAYSEFSLTSSSSGSNELLSRLRGVSLIDASPAAGAVSSLSLAVSQGSAFGPVIPSGNLPPRGLTRASAPLPRARVGQPKNDQDDESSGSSGAAEPDTKRPRHAPPSQPQVVTWRNLFDDIPENTEYAANYPAHWAWNPLAHLPESSVPPGGIVPVIPDVIVAGPPPEHRLMEQEDVPTLPLIPLLEDSDRASRPLAMRRRPAPVEDDVPHFVAIAEGHWPSLPPAALPRSASSGTHSSSSSSE